MTGGAFRADLALRADLAPAEYFVKALAWDEAQAAVAALTVTLGAQAEAR